MLAELLALIDERILRAEPLQIRAAVPQVRTQFRFSFFRAFYEFEFAGGQEILDTARQQLFEITIYEEPMRFC